MKRLFVDTTTQTIRMAILSENVVVHEVLYRGNQDHSIHTLPQLDSLFKSSKTNPSEISEIILGVGPGSYTGIRMGVTMVKTFAWIQDVPVRVITSFEQMITMFETELVIPVIFARKDFVYAGVFENQKILVEPVVMSLESFYILSKQYPNAIIVGEDVTSFALDVKFIPQDYSKIPLQKILEYALKKEMFSAHQIRPLYYQQPPIHQANSGGDAT